MRDRTLVAAALVPALLVGAGWLTLALAPLPLLSPDAPAEDPVALEAATASFRLVATGAHGPELNLGIDAAGAIYVGGWDHVARSLDRGLTWTPFPVPVVPRPGALGSIAWPGVNVAADRVLVVDKDTGRVFVDDTNLGCTILHWSDDGGATWESSYVACGGGITDHQKVAVGKRTQLTDPTGLLYPNIVYVCANGLSHTNCGASVDGGLTFLPAAPHGELCAFQGMPVAGPDGTLYEPSSTCGGQVRLTRDNGLTWVTRSLPVAPSADTPDLAVDDAGNLYVSFTTREWKPAFLRSTDDGATWQGPFEVPVPGLTSAVFPVVTAGAEGRIALSFYATTDDDPAWDHNPGRAPDAVRWHGYVAIVEDALAAAPTIEAVQVTPAGDPLQYGCLSKLGSCLGNIADYMDIDVGPDGRVVAVYTDGCPATCTKKSESNDDRAVVAIQQDGPRLRG